MNKFDRFETYLDRESKRIKNLFDKYKNIFRFLCLIIILLVLGLLIYFYKDVYKNSFFKFVFLNRQGDFQWLGLTALIAIISLTVTAWDNRRKLKADLISKSRIEWMEELRPILSKYLNSIIDYIHERKQLNEFKEQGATKSQIDDQIRRMEKTYTKFNMEYSMLMMFIPDNQSNSIILEPIRKLRLFVLHVNQKKIEEKQIDLILGLFVEDTLKKVNDYLKREWERAKQGK